MRPRVAALVAPLLVAGLGACSAAASDADGEVFVAGPMTPAAPKQHDAVPVVVDTDLGPDDLAALALLVRHSRVEVVGLTVPQTGMVTCDDGLGLLADLFAALRTPAPPVACGTTARGPQGVPFPADWTRKSTTMSGLDRDEETGGLTPVRGSAATFIARLTHRYDDLRLVALGPLTEPATVLRDDPAAFGRLAGITTMAGAEAAPSHLPGIAEWNAGADPEAFAEVVAGPVPVTVVPADPVPMGAPDGLAGPVVGGLGRVPGFESPAYWDLAAAGVFVAPEVATVRTGTWAVDTTHDRGRLSRTGGGRVAVVTGVDAEALDEVYDEVFG